jgi:hypothetical protein
VKNDEAIDKAIATFSLVYHWQQIVIERQYSARIVLQSALLLRSWASLLILSGRPDSDLCFAKAAQGLEIMLRTSAVTLPIIPSNHNDSYVGPTAIVSKRRAVEQTSTKITKSSSISSSTSNLYFLS